MPTAETPPTRDDLLRFLESLLASSDEFVRWHVARAIGLWRLSELAPQLVHLLGRPASDLGDTDVRRIAARSLGRLGFDVLSASIDELVHHDNSLIREGIADALGETRDLRGLNHLYTLAKDPENHVSMWAALSLSKLGTHAVPVLERLLGEVPSQERAIYILDALKKIGSPETYAIMRNYLATTPYQELSVDRRWLER